MTMHVAPDAAYLSVDPASRQDNYAVKANPARQPIHRFVLTAFRDLI